MSDWSTMAQAGASKSSVSSEDLSLKCSAANTSATVVDAYASVASTENVAKTAATADRCFDHDVATAVPRTPPESKRGYHEVSASGTAQASGLPQSPKEAAKEK